jgi:uncharacterized protein YcfL
MFKKTISLKNTITLIALLAIAGCSSQSHHHRDKTIQANKIVVFKPIAVKKTIIRKPIGANKRVVVVYR